MAKIHGKSKIGKGTYLGENVIIGYPGLDELQKLLDSKFNEVAGAKIGDNCIIRDYGVVYSNVILGNNVRTGHHFLIREHTSVGDNTLIGTGVVIEANCKIGSNCSIQSNAYLSTNTVIKDNVFIGPRAVFINDKYMGRGEVKLVAPQVEKGARIGANSTILPSVIIGKDSLVGAGAVVTEDVAPYTVVAGVPARKIGNVPKEHRL